MEKEIDLLKKHLKETENKQQTLLKTYQEREQKLRNDLKEVKSQKENALTRLGLWLISTNDVVFSNLFCLCCIYHYRIYYDIYSS